MHIRKGVLVLSGYGLRIAVERGHLVAEDGVGEHRRIGRFSRIAKLRRLVVLGHAGTVSLEALRWLRDVGAAFIQIDADGQVVTASGPIAVSDPRVLRAQASAAATGVGLSIARRLVHDKLKGQLGVLRQLPEPKEARGRIRAALTLLERSPSIEHLRYVEADAARAYWGTWEPVVLGFGRREAKRVPSHWVAFGARTSPLTGSPRTAANPANAMLNYLYAILEAEARIATLALGLDPGLGLYHADQRWRNSLACDLMEPVRPAVDAHLLRLLQTKTFHRADFFENRQGACRVLSPLSQQLAQTGTRWAQAVAPVAEQVARALVAAAARRRTSAATSVSTPLSGRNRSRGRQRTAADHASATARKRAQRAAEHHTAIREWSWRHHGTAPPDPQVFQRELLPGLQRFTLAALAKATGLSRGYCARIRKGEVVPHPRHWEGLREAAQTAI